MATSRLHDFARVDGLWVPPAWALESQCVFLDFARSSDLGLRFQSFCHCLNFDDRARESRGDGTPRFGGADEFHDHP